MANFQKRDRSCNRCDSEAGTRLIATYLPKSTGRCRIRYLSVESPNPQSSVEGRRSKVDSIPRTHRAARDLRVRRQAISARREARPLSIRRTFASHRHARARISAVLRILRAARNRNQQKRNRDERAHVHRRARLMPLIRRKFQVISDRKRQRDCADCQLSERFFRA